VKRHPQSECRQQNKSCSRCAGLTFDQSRSTTQNPFSALNPQFAIKLSFEFTQPLVRNRRIDAARHQIRIAKSGIAHTQVRPDGIWQFVIYRLCIHWCRCARFASPVES